MDSEFNLTFYEAIEKVMTGNFVAVGELFTGAYYNFQIEKRGSLVLVNSMGVVVVSFNITDWMVNQKFMLKSNTL